MEWGCEWQVLAHKGSPNPAQQPSGGLPAPDPRAWTSSKWLKSLLCNDIRGLSKIVKWTNIQFSICSHVKKKKNQWFPGFQSWSKADWLFCVHVSPSGVQKEMDCKQEFQLWNIPHPKSPLIFSIPDASPSATRDSKNDEKTLMEASGWGKPCLERHHPFIAFFWSWSFTIMPSSQLGDLNYNLTKICVEASVWRQKLQGSWTSDVSDPCTHWLDQDRRCKRSRQQIHSE